MVNPEYARNPVRQRVPKLAVYPCKKFRFPTGPISPCAKNPATGIGPETFRCHCHIMVRSAKESRPRPQQLNMSAPSGGCRWPTRSASNREFKSSVADSASRRWNCTV